MTKRGFLYFFVAFLFFLISVEFFIVSIVNIQEIDLIAGAVLALTFLVSLSVSGIIVDKFYNRMNLLLWSALGQIAGLILLIQDALYLNTIGLSLIIFFAAVYIVDLFTVVTHESTILNRGRLTAYLLFTSSLVGSIIMVFTFGSVIVVLIIEGVIFFFLYKISRVYHYTETKDRLTSKQKFGEVVRVNQSIYGYLAAFGVLGFVLGNAFPFEITLSLDPASFIVISLIFLIIAGVVLDKMGRKWAITGGILVLSSLIIFSGIFKELYNSIFFGISLPIVFVILFTMTGDFSTERNTLKYRGRITGLFLSVVIGGFLSGIIVKYVLSQIIYMSNPAIFYWMPELINGINSLLLIVLLVWIMPLPEVLSSKEANWAGTLRNLYVFNKDSICLFAKNFIPEDQMLDLPPEDLITGGLSGILTLISEITNEKKNLRIIDKDRVKIYFSYGKSVIIALISSKYLPVLFKKLESFTKAFERKFEDELLHFRGKINVFLNRTENLLQRYF